MAQDNQQGTGKHSHKSTDEPYHHTKQASGSSSHSGSSHGGSAGPQGSTGSRQQESGGQQSGSRSHSGSGSSGPSGGSSDLKSREYKDEQGNVHHHTHTYEQQHGKK